MKIGVIGLGSIGLRHAKNLLVIGHEVFGYDPDPDREHRLVCAGGQLSGAPYPCGYGVDGVIVASPTWRHRDDIAQLFTRGFKNVFVEKPITSSLEIECAPQVSMVGYNLRFHPCVTKAKEWMSRIGKPIWASFVCAQYNDKPDYLRDGVILNWSHEIDLALYLLGPARVAASSTQLRNGQDVLTDIILTHECGARSSIHLDYLTKKEQRHFMIQGETGKMTCVLPSRNLFLHSGETDTFDWFACPGTWDDDYKREMEAFVDRIDGKETLGCSGKEALEVLTICLEIRKHAGLTN